VDPVTWDSFIRAAKVLQQIPSSPLDEKVSPPKIFVFTGGMILKLLVNQPLSAEIRPSNDIDTIVAVSRLGYEQLKLQLKRLGVVERASQSDEDSVMCRFWMGDVKIDIMPDDPKILGFANRFFGIAHETAILTEIEKGFSIWHVNAPAFLATKSVAFRDRGLQDILISKDLEDILTVLQGRSYIKEEVFSSSFEIREEISRLANTLLNHSYIQDLYGPFMDETLLRSLILKD
jgi:hypothetical protein